MILRASGLPAVAVCLFLALPALPASGQISELVAPVPGGVDVESPSGDRLQEKAAYIAMYDDGEVDVFVRSAATTYEIAMLFGGVGGPDVTLGGVDLCLRQTGADPKIRYEVVIWAANGPGGTPGTELAKFAAVATGVTATPAFYSTNLNYPLTTTNVYIGVRYNPVVDPDFWFCVDTDGIGGAPAQPVYRRANESGGWSNLGNLVPTYKALMIRAFLSTPGVFAETLLVPFYLIDRTEPFGTTTLFAVRNLTGSPISATVEYFTRGGSSQRTEMLSLDPYETETVNIRDVPGLAVSMDGFSRGYVAITTGGNPDMTPVLAGDYFQVDVDDNFATGDKLVRQITLCDEATIRFLRFAFPGSGTRLTVWISNPRGTSMGDPPSFSVQAYDENGNPSGGLISVFTTLHAMEFDASTFSTLGFGHLRFDFSNGGGGTVYAEYSTQERFSVGVSSQCDDLP
jgi:hypothetical protein